MGWPQQNAVAADIRRAAAREGDADHMSLWAGQAAALAGADRPAAEIIDRIMDDAVASIRGLGDALGGTR